MVAKKKKRKLNKKKKIRKIVVKLIEIESRQWLHQGLGERGKLGVEGYRVSVM